MLDKDAIQALTKAEAITAAATALLQADDVVALPADFGLHDLEIYAQYRRRARGTMTTSVVADFADYTAAHAADGAAVFVDPDAMAARAVLNLGTQDAPGHADDVAELKLRATAPYAAVTAKGNGQPMPQATLAEFLEDWAPHIKCQGEAGDIDIRKAVAAVRRITIEALRKVEASEQQLSASRSAFEQVQASSVEPIPTFITFTCEPFAGLQERTLRMRLGVITTDKPALSLRIINHELHREEMAAELAGLVREAIGDVVAVHIGCYSAKR